MARDHARIHLDIWGDDDFLDLPVDAQMLYFTLYTSEGRTLCGAHQWSAKKLTQRAGDWTVDRIEAAAQILSERLFLIIDADTDECLLRSWIKHDGLWRTPNMAVSVANARGNVASRTLRGVIVHEVLKLRAAEPTSTSWARDQVRNMLTQKAIDPATLEPFKGGSNGAFNPSSNPTANGTSNPYETVNPNPSDNGASNGAPTNAIPIANAIPAKAGARPPRSRTFSEMTRGAPDPTPEPPPPDPGAIGVAATEAAELVDAVIAHGRYPDKVMTGLRRQVAAMLIENIDRDLIRETLRLWDQRDEGGPGLLPHLLADAAKSLRPNGSGKPPPSKRKVNAALDLANRFANPPEQTALEAR